MEHVIILIQNLSLSTVAADLCVCPPVIQGSLLNKENSEQTGTRSWKGAQRRCNPVKTITMRRAWIATSLRVGIRDDVL
jgi:hypothetical protein